MRQLTNKEIPFVIDCLYELRKYSPVYGHVMADEEYVRNSLTEMFKSSNTISSYVEDRGFMLGTVGFNWYSPEIMAYEQLLYVRKDYRGGSTAVRLIKDFEQLAQDKGAVEIRAGATIGTTDELAFKLYERLGYERLGTGVRKRI